MQDDEAAAAPPRRVATTLRYRADVKEAMKRRAKATGRTLTNYLEYLVLVDDGQIEAASAVPKARDGRAQA